MEDLIKRLEKLELPDIKIRSHKTELRAVLLNSRHFKKRSFFEGLRKYFIFAVPAFSLLLIAGLVFIKPKLAEVKALKIARNNQEIQKLMGDGNLVFKDVKIQDGKAYILLNLPEANNGKETDKTAKTSNIEITKNDNKSNNARGTLIEVNLSRNNVDKIESVKNTPLNSQEEEEAKKIVENEAVVQDILTKNAKFEKIEAVPSRELSLVEKDKKIEIVDHPESEKRAEVHYESDGKKWTIKVNLSQKKVEGMEYSLEEGEDEED